MLLETFGTVLMLRMELVLDIGFRVNEIACQHLDIFGITVVLLCDVYIPYCISIAFISILSIVRQDTFCHIWFTNPRTVYSVE